MAKKLGDLAKVPPKQKAILAVLFCLLVVVGYYYLYYREASQQVASLESNLAALRSKIKEQEVIAGNLKSFQEEVRRLEEQLARLLRPAQTERFVALHDKIHGRFDRYLWASEAAPSAVAIGPGGR